jgi:hypothetical protein
MTIYIDLRDQIQVRANRRKVSRYIKTGLKISLYGYIGMRLVMGGTEAIVAYGKATAIFKGIDILVAKIVH